MNLEVVSSINKGIDKKCKIKKMFAIMTIVLGIILIGISLYLDINMPKSPYRGTILILGALSVILGVYTFPTKKHKLIVNILFLFPLLFAFSVTVLIPFICGIFYSLTNWNGIKFTEFVGLENYITMFKSNDYIYSFVVTFIFTVINMLLVNITAFLLALFCTSKVKGKNFYRAAFFIPNLIGGIVLGYVWQFIFNKL